jgi:hypothetical protein
MCPAASTAEWTVDLLTDRGTPRPTRPKYRARLKAGRPRRADRVPLLATSETELVSNRHQSGVLRFEEAGAQFLALRTDPETRKFQAQVCDVPAAPDLLGRTPGTDGQEGLRNVHEETPTRGPGRINHRPERSPDAARPEPHRLQDVS